MVSCAPVRPVAETPTNRICPPWRRKTRAIVDNLRAAKMNTAADLVERSVSETLTYYAFPDIHLAEDPHHG